MSATREARAHDFTRRLPLLREAVLGLLIALGTLLAVRGLGRGPVAVAIGGFDAPTAGSLGQGSPRVDLDPQASRDDRLDLLLPSPARRRPCCGCPCAPGAARLSFRARAMVRSSLGAFVLGVPVPEVLVDTGPWDRYALEVPAAAARREGLELGPFPAGAPVVAGAHVGRPEVFVDEVTLSGARAWRSPGRVLCLAGDVPDRDRALRAGCWAIARGRLGRRSRGGRRLLVVACARLRSPATRWPCRAWRRSPSPRGRRVVPAAPLPAVEVRTAAAWARIVAAGFLARASRPCRSSPTTTRRTCRRTSTARWTSRTCPWEYQALLRYGSHLPTASQTAAPATDLFGCAACWSRTRRCRTSSTTARTAGRRPALGMTAAQRAAGDAVAPLLFLAARRIWDERAAWLAAASTCSTWPSGTTWARARPGRLRCGAGHGGARSPGRRVRGLTRARPVLVMGAFAGAGRARLLRRSSCSSACWARCCSPLLLADARGLTRPRALRRGDGAGGRRRSCDARSTTGTTLPGISQGTPGVEAEPSIFTGKTVLGIFRNEGRQSYRIWAMGFAWPLAGGTRLPCRSRSCARAPVRPPGAGGVAPRPGSLIMC